MLYCDGVLDSCDADTVFRNQKLQCFLCKNLGCFLKNSLGLDFISYRDYLSDSDIREIKEKVKNLDVEELLDYNYLGVNVGVHAHSSAIRYFLFGKLDLVDATQVAILRKKLIYAMITTKIAERIYLKEKPNAVFMLHGGYSTWGPFRDYFRSKNVDTIIYSNMPPRFGHFIFNRNNRANEIVSAKDWLTFSHLPLTEREEKEIDVFFAKRFRGEIGDQKMYEKNFNPNLEKTSILESFLKNKYSWRYIMYPNLAWDVGIEGKVSEIFEGVFDWIDTTIEFFKRKPDYQLIIKPHPAELIWEKCSKGIVDYIKEKHGSLPDNIILLDPNIPLTPYDLIDSRSVGLTFNGTIGLELAIAGIPVITVSYIHYREVGITKKINTLNEYFRLLENPEELISFAKKNWGLAKKYAYFYFFKSMLRIPFYRDDKWSTIDWDVVGDVKKLLDDDSNIIKICKKIINKEDIVAPL
jgi:hypothetical protein